MGDRSATTAVVIVSAFALIVRSTIFGSFGPERNETHRISTSSRSPVSRFNRTMGWKVWGYVPARPEVGQRGAMNGEILGYFLFVRTTDVTATDRFSSPRTIRAV
jgi:hypothetical protein